MDDDCTPETWFFVTDWAGAPSLPNGVNDVSYWVCDDCGQETNERPEGIEDGYPGPDFDRKHQGDMIDEAVDYVYDPLRNEP